jgi:hypothetical protein
MVFRSASLLQHPFPDVWRTVQDRDPCRLTHVEKTNTFDIREIEFLQIQRDAWSTTLDLRLQLIKVLISKLPAQANARSALTRYLFDLQRHKSLGPKHTPNHRNKQAICNFLGEKRFGGASGGETSPFGEISPRRNRIKKKRKGGAEGGTIMTS